MEVNISLSGNPQEIAEVTGLFKDMKAETKKLNDSESVVLDENERLLLIYFNELDDLEKGRMFSKAEALAEAARRQRKSADMSKKANSKVKQ